MSCMFTGTSTVAPLPSISLPPWAGVEPLPGAPRDVAGARHPPVNRPIAVESAPTNASVITAMCQKNRIRQRHFHQLLRLRELQALQGGVLDDRGHVDNLLLNCRRELGNDLQDVHRLVNQLQHRNIEGRERDGVDVLHHGVRCTCSCGLTPARWSGRTPPGSSSNDRSKSSGWEKGVSRIVAVWFCSLSPSPALAFFCPLGAAWWLHSARAIVTLRRSCRSHCLSPRSRRLRTVLSCSP